MDAEDRHSLLQPLLQGLTHEIRNPVQGILASADALRYRYEHDVMGVQLLDMIQRECRRIDQLLTDLLDLARPVTVDHAKSHSLNALLEESIRAFKQQNGVAQVSIEIDPLPDLHMDQQSMRRAILALLQNAMESKPSDIAIRIAAHHTAGHVEVQISDNGSGILPEDLNRVLEPFFSTRPKKAGLGLTIAERIIRLHDGQLRIHSGNEEGTVVTLQLPVR